MVAADDADAAERGRREQDRHRLGQGEGVRDVELREPEHRAVGLGHERQPVRAELDDVAAVAGVDVAEQVDGRGLEDVALGLHGGAEGHLQVLAPRAQVEAADAAGLARAGKRLDVGVVALPVDREAGPLVAGAVEDVRRRRHELERALRPLRDRGPGDLGGDRRDAVAELIERQALEHQVDQIAERRRGVGADLLLDVLDDERVRLLVGGAAVEAEPVALAPHEIAHGVGEGVGAAGREVGRLQVGEELLARPQAQEARARPLGERDREVGVVAVLGDLLAAAEDAVAFLPGVLVLDDVGRPDHRAGELLHAERDRNDVAVGRGRDRGVAETRPLDVRPARAEQEAAEDRAGRGADRAEEVAARDREAEGADGGDARP